MIVKVNEAADMFEVQRERVVVIFEKWRAPLGLKWWTVELSWEYDRSLFTHDDSDFECIAFVNGHWPYRTATIHINMHLLHERDDDELEQDILHEMVHIPLFEMQPEQQDFVDHRERVVCTLTNAFQWVREAGYEEGFKAGLKGARRKK
jgi:hypothetical protein